MSAIGHVESSLLDPLDIQLVPALKLSRCPASLKAADSPEPASGAVLQCKACSVSVNRQGFPETYLALS